MRDLLGGTEDPAAIRGKVECDAGDVAAMPLRRDGAGDAGRSVVAVATDEESGRAKQGR
jgi:hypothetical protein